MKRFAILLVICFAITQLGCSKEEPATTSKPEVQPAPATKTAETQAKQIAKQTTEKVAQVAKQAEEKVGAVINQVKSGLGSGQATYMKACASCHKLGIIGAPKVGDKKAWAPKIADGKEELVQNAIKGVGSMPPKGGSSSLSNDEVKAAVEYMIKQSQ